MSSWQDIVLTIINFGFLITAVPAIIRNYRHKEAKSQSFSMYFATAVLLSVMAYVFLTLDLLFSCISTAGTGIMWFILTYQKIIYSKEKN
jgi:VIT1/CCC1 family predicted Fe2+/Mn2+ transporter